MKTTTTCLVLLAAACGGLIARPLTAAPEKQSAMMYRVTEVIVNGHPIIQPGTSLNAVRAAIGSPHKQLSPDLWVYRNFQASAEQARRDGCRELVIEFTNDRVSSIRLVNPRAENVILARLQAGASPNRAQAAVLQLPATGSEVASR